MIKLYKTFTKLHQVFVSKLGFTLKMVNFFTDNYLHILEFECFSIKKTFCDCSFAETSTYVKGLYNVSERLRLNKP